MISEMGLSSSSGEFINGIICDASDSSGVELEERIVIFPRVGVGSSEATPAAATLQWLVRDGTGMIGRILFAWMKG